MPEVVVNNKGCGAGWRGRLWFACVLALVGMTPGRAPAQVSETVLHNFASQPAGGIYPKSSLFRDSAGNLYGIAGGGSFGYGVVFKLDTAGRESVLHSFTGGADGSNRSTDPGTGVVGDAAGNLYGTAYSGGSNSGFGLVFKLDSSGHETVLHTFRNAGDGAQPNSLIRDAAGNLYGTTSSDVVFKIDTASHFSVLHHFHDGRNGFWPVGLAIDAAGKLYGTTHTGGIQRCNNASEGCGVIYRLDPAGNYTVLYSFTGGSDGATPQSGVILDSSGNLYGTTSSGGTGSCRIGNTPGCGVVYKLDAGGNYTVLHYFAGTDGSNPSAGVIADSAGNLYGTTATGGNLSACGGYGCGVVYKLDPAGSYTVLHTFTGGADGSGSISSLPGVIRDSAGNLYGTTEYGGTSVEYGGAGGGVVYKLDTTGQETVLYNFLMFPPGGYWPQGGLAGDAAGNLYGTTNVGGVGECYSGNYSGCGVLYKMDTSARYTVLHSFMGGADGGLPNGVIRDAAGNTYGTAGYGVSGNGVIYKLDAAGNYTVLYTFTGGTGGAGPNGIVRDSTGNFYGTAAWGGVDTCEFGAGCGVVYKLDSSGHFTVLHSFTGGSDGTVPNAGMIRDAAGNLYGATQRGGAGTDAYGYGVIYKVDAGGNFSVLHTFTGSDGDKYPISVIRDSSGNLYGTCSGAVFKLDAEGNYTILYSFTNGTDGSGPLTGVVEDPAGNLYGTSSLLSTGNGLVYKLDTAGNFTVLYTFTGGADGTAPNALVRGPGGSLLGTTPAGGKFGGGNVFAVSGLP